jgi:hypothetical protein
MSESQIKEFLTESKKPASKRAIGRIPLTESLQSRPAQVDFRVLLEQYENEKDEEIPDEKDDEKDFNWGSLAGDDHEEPDADDMGGEPDGDIDDMGDEEDLDSIDGLSDEDSMGDEVGGEMGGEMSELGADTEEMPGASIPPEDAAEIEKSIVSITAQAIEDVVELLGDKFGIDGNVSIQVNDGNASEMNDEMGDDLGGEMGGDSTMDALGADATATPATDSAELPPAEGAAPEGEAAPEGGDEELDDALKGLSEEQKSFVKNFLKEQINSIKKK